MVKSKRVMRRLILSRLYDLMQDHFSIFYSREKFVGGELTIHELDGLLAFKSDAQLEELRHALDRLEEGSFGVCISCKSMISQEVLDNDPTQRICSSCEEKFVHFSSPRGYHHHVTT